MQKTFKEDWLNLILKVSCHFSLNSFFFYTFFAPGSHGDSFHTPPVTPVSDGPAYVPKTLHPTSPQPSSPAPISSPPPVPASSVKKAPSGLNPTPSSPPLDLRPRVKNASNSITADPRAGLILNQVKGQASLGRNGSPPTSTPRGLLSQRKPVTVTPTKSPLSQCSVSPLVGNSSEQNWKERDSGLSHSLLGGGESRSEDLEKLLEECKTTLGITGRHDGATSTAGTCRLQRKKRKEGDACNTFNTFWCSCILPSEILKHLMSEVKTLRSTLQVRPLRKCDGMGN